MQVLSKMACVTILVSASLQEASASSGALDPLLFAQSFWDEALSSAAARDTSRAQADLLSAQVETAKIAHLPTASLSAALGRNKHDQYEDTTKTNGSEKATTSANAGVNASLRLWSGGLDSLTVESARQRQKSAEIDADGFRDRIKAELVRDLAKLVTLSLSHAQHEKELLQWRLLNTMTRQKAKAGLLNVRDVQQSDRELLNAQGELNVSGDTLAKEVRLFNLRYGLERSAVDVSQISRLAEQLAVLMENGRGALLRENFNEVVTQKNSEFRKVVTDRNALNFDFSAKRTAEWSPTLLATSDATATYLDTVNSTSASLSRSRGLPAAREPNWDLALAVGLRFSLSLFNPRGGAQTDEALLQLKSVGVRENSTLRSVSLQCEAYRSDQKILETRLQEMSKVAKISQDLVNGNKRLFDAGLIDTFQLIRGLQDLYAQERGILQQEGQLRNLLVVSALAENLGVLL